MYRDFTLIQRFVTLCVLFIRHPLHFLKLRKKNLKVEKKLGGKLEKITKVKTKSWVKFEKVQKLFLGTIQQPNRSDLPLGLVWQVVLTGSMPGYPRVAAVARPAAVQQCFLVL